MTPVATSHILATNYEQSQEQDIGAPHTHTHTYPDILPPDPLLPLDFGLVTRLMRGPLLTQR